MLITSDGIVFEIISKIPEKEVYILASRGGGRENGVIQLLGRTPLR